MSSLSAGKSEEEKRMAEKSEEDLRVDEVVAKTKEQLAKVVHDFSFWCYYSCGFVASSPVRCHLMLRDYPGK